jgi:hypothetical protein
VRAQRFPTFPFDQYPPDAGLPRAKLRGHGPTPAEGLRPAGGPRFD